MIDKNLEEKVIDAAGELLAFSGTQLRSQVAFMQLTFKPYVVPIFSRNTPKSGPNEILVVHCLSLRDQERKQHHTG